VIAQDEISKENKIQELEQDNKQEEIDKKMYPDEIAGVKRGKPMSPSEAGGKNVNPNYDINSYEYTHNCQTCNVAYHARLLGYDVQAKGYDENNTMQNALEQNLALAYIDPKTGSIPKMVEKSVKDNSECYELFSGMIKSNESYSLVWRWNNDKIGHTAIIRKGIDNELCIYDAQKGKEISGNENIQKYMEQFAYDSPIKYLRTDNLVLFEPIASKVLEKSKH